MSALPNTHRSRLLKVYALLIELNNTAAVSELPGPGTTAAEPGQNQSARQRQSTMRRVTMQIGGYRGG